MADTEEDDLFRQMEEAITANRRQQMTHTRSGTAPGGDADRFAGVKGFFDPTKREGDEVQTRGDILPAARMASGDLKFAVPGIIRDVALGTVNLGEMATGKQPYDEEVAVKSAMDVGMGATTFGGGAVPKGALAANALRRRTPEEIAETGVAWRC